jgi:hypothetical protein
MRRDVEILVSEHVVEILEILVRRDVKVLVIISMVIVLVFYVLMIDRLWRYALYYA